MEKYKSKLEEGSRASKLAQGIAEYISELYSMNLSAKDVQDGLTNLMTETISNLDRESRDLATMLYNRNF